MASGIFAVLDDIAMLLDDAAAMSKVAARKTASILGDDVAVSAKEATGFRASRELPVLWAISKGSLINKLIILPLAFLLSAFAPFMIVPILLLGGVYLSFEGMEKVFHYFFHKEAHQQKLQEMDEAAFKEHEAKKISSAIKMDFILSIEIIMIALGSVSNEAIILQIIVVSLIAVAATIGVYGLVALLVRMDDVGLYMIDKAEVMQGLSQKLLSKMGLALVQLLPIIIKVLSVVGTLAMLLVGGGLFVHNIEMIHHLLHFMPDILSELLVGVVVGSATVMKVKFIQSLLKK